jgi:hypothetical protein
MSSRTHVRELLLHTCLPQKISPVGRNDNFFWLSRSICNLTSHIFHQLKVFPSASQKTRAAKPKRFVVLKPNGFHRAGKSVLI